MKESVKTKTFEQANTGLNVSEETEGKAVIYAGGIGGALIGIWGLACLASGLIQSGGPLALIGNWFKAVSGL